MRSRIDISPRLRTAKRKRGEGQDTHLVDRVRIREAPPTRGVRGAHILARVAAARSIWRLAAIAAATVVGAVQRGKPRRFALETWGEKVKENEITHRALGGANAQDMA